MQLPSNITKHSYDNVFIIRGTVYYYNCTIKQVLDIYISNEGYNQRDMYIAVVLIIRQRYTWYGVFEVKLLTVIMAVALSARSGVATALDILPLASPISRQIIVDNCRLPEHNKISQSTTMRIHLKFYGTIIYVYEHIYKNIYRGMHATCKLYSYLALLTLSKCLFLLYKKNKLYI